MASGIAILAAAITFCINVTVAYVVVLTTSIVQGIVNTITASGIGTGFLKYSDFQFIFIFIWVLLAIVMAVCVYRLMETFWSSSTYEMGY